jgi:D-threo-aldose 1-dehydrogenase
MSLCTERGISVVVGAPFCSGILAPGTRSDAWYGYLAPEPGMVEKVERMEAVCARHGTSVAAAALQFPFGHPAVAAVIPGPESAQHVRTNLALMRETIPPALWGELKDLNLLRRDAPTP